MIKNALLETRMARGIARKAGLVAGTGEIGSSEVIYFGHDYLSTNFDIGWEYPYFEGVLGLWPIHMRFANTGNVFNPGGQFVYIDPRGLAYVRVVATLASATAAPDVAFVPVYSAERTPLYNAGTLNEEPDPAGLGVFYTPDGRTLLAWHEDYKLGGPKSFTWPPKGSLVYPTIGNITANGGAGCHGGRWSAPLSATQVGAASNEMLIGVAIISRKPAGGSKTDNVFNVQLQGITTPASEAFLTHFADKIDD